MEKLISKILSFFARTAIARHKPAVIGIVTGGESACAKNAVYHILGGQFRAVRSMNNYRGKLGCSLFVLGLEYSKKSFFFWPVILFRAFKTAYISKDYPEALIMELASEKIGDMEKIAKSILPDIVILISAENRDFQKLGSARQAAREKTSIIKYIKKGGKLIYNFDDGDIAEAAKTTRMETISFGFKKGADLQVVSGDNLRFHSSEKNISSTVFKVETAGSFMPVRINSVLGKNHIYSILAAIAAGMMFGINLVDAVENLRNFSLQKY